MAVGNQVGTVSIKVTPDTTKFRAELEAQLKRIDPEVPVKLELDENGIRQKVRSATSGLDSKATVTLDVDKSALDRLRKDLDGGGGGRDRFFAIGGGGGGGGGLGVFSSFVDNLAVAAAVASIAAPALALVTGALTAMPAVLAAVATPIGVIALGLDGLKNASKSLSEPLTKLKSDISGVFEARLTPVFEQLSRALPKLTGPLASVAHGISDVASAFINTISTGPGMANLQGTISNIAKTISTMSPGVSSLTNGLLGLANNVSAKFPQVGEWFNKAAEGFANWVDKSSKDGSLDQAMKTLGGVGKETLDLVGDLAKQGFDFLKDPAFGEDMKTFVANLRSLTNDALPGLKNFFTDLAGAIDSAVKAIEKAKSLVNSLPAWMKPDSGEDSGGGPFGPNAPIRQPPKFAGKKLDHSWGDAFDPKNLFGPGWWEKFKDSQLAEGFKPENLFGDFDMTGIWEKIKAGFNPDNLLGTGTGSEIWNSLGITPTAAAEVGQQAGVGVGQGLGQGFQTAAAAGGIQTQIQALGPQIQAALAGATAQLQTIPGQIQQAFSGVGAAVTGSMAVVVGAVANAGGQIVAAFTGSLSQIPGVATAVFGQVQAAAAAGMANVVTAITSGAAQAVAAVTSMGTQIIAAMQSAAAGAQSAGAAIGQGLAAGIRSSTGAAVAAAQAMAAAVTAASQVKLGIKSPSKVFSEIGAQTAQGLQDGLEGGFSGVIERATALSAKLTEAVNGGLAGVDSKALTDGIKQQLDELELQRKQLKVDKDAVPKEDKEKRAGIQGQLDQITAIKDQLGLQKDQLGFAGKYGDELDSHKESISQANNMITESIASMIDGIKGFAMANVNQFQSDLGISGQGAIPQLANQGLDFLSSTLSKALSSPFQQGSGTNITVNSVDEALAAKQTLDNKKALQFAGR